RAGARPRRPQARRRPAGPEGHRHRGAPGEGTALRQRRRHRGSPRAAGQAAGPGRQGRAPVLGVQHVRPAAPDRVPSHGGPMTERLIVIGGGGAGPAAPTIAKRVKPDLHVTLFTEFPDIAYSPCGIPFVHGGEIEKFENLFLSTVERYVEDGLDMRMETTVTDIDMDRGTITARNTHEGFDKLILCTGFTWEKPAVEGANLDGLHYVKDIRAAMLFDEELAGMKRVSVIWATPLGVEMAGTLGHRGLAVDFIDEGPWVLSE